MRAKRQRIGKGKQDGPGPGALYPVALDDAITLALTLLIAHSVAVTLPVAAVTLGSQLALG